MAQRRYEPQYNSPRPEYENGNRGYIPPRVSPVPMYTQHPRLNYGEYRQRDRSPEPRSPRPEYENGDRGYIPPRVSPVPMYTQHPRLNYGEYRQRDRSPEPRSPRPEYENGNRGYIPPRVSPVPMYTQHPRLNYGEYRQRDRSPEPPQRHPQHGYADPRHIPPAVSPVPLYKQYPQPFYNHDYRQQDRSPEPPMTIVDHKTNPHHPDYDPTFVPEVPEPLYKHYEQPEYSSHGPLRQTPAPSNTLYGYADPRHIPPAVSPEPGYKQHPQPKYYESGPRDGGGNTNEPDYKSTRPKEGHRNYQSEQFQQKKFDYQVDDRFHRVPEQQQNYDRSPRRDYHEGYDRSPRRDYQEEVNRVNAPRQQQPDELPPAGRANTYSTKITDLLTSLRDPARKDDRVEKLMEANKGYLVLMRFLEGDLSEVVTAVQENIGTLHAHNGYVIGFAESRDMTILLASNDMIAKSQWWDPKFDYKSRYAVAGFWFKDVFQAKRWFESTNRLKQHDFPNANPYQVIAVPLTYGRNKEPMPFSPNVAPVTLLWCEFPNIYERFHNDFLANYSEPARQRMKDFGGNPNVSISKFEAGWPADANKYGQPGYRGMQSYHERVGRAIKTGWVQDRTFITVSTFPSMDDAVKFYTDEYYQREIRSRLDNYSNPVFVGITLRPVRGTSKYY